MYWEQYLNLRLLVLLGVLSALMVIFACCLALLLSGWAATLCTVQSALQLCQLLGAMHLLNLKLSAVTGAALIASVGLGATVNAQIMLVSGNSLKSLRKSVNILSILHFRAS